MDDLDRLLTLVNLATDPKAAQKNAAVLKEIQAEQVTNRQILKEVNVGRSEIAAERKRLQAAWQEINNAKTDLKAEYAKMEEEKRSRQAAYNASVETDNKRKAIMKEIEDEHARRIEAFKSDIKTFESATEAARIKKREVEAEVAALLRRHGSG